MATRDWLGLKEELPHRRKVLLTVLSFLVPFVTWCAVSYIPWLWHPNMHITVPGDVDYFVEDMDVPRADFQRELEKVRAAGGTLPEGLRVNPVYLPAPHQVARAFYRPFTPLSLLSRVCRMNRGFTKASGIAFAPFCGASLSPQFSECR
jgi:NitT/TauT family transport system permease protein